MPLGWLLTSIFTSVVHNASCRPQHFTSTAQTRICIFELTLKVHLYGLILFVGFIFLSPATSADNGELDLTGIDDTELDDVSRRICEESTYQTSGSQPLKSTRRLDRILKILLFWHGFHFWCFQESVLKTFWCHPNGFVVAEFGNN